MHYYHYSMPSFVFSMNFDRYYKQINRITFINEKKRRPYKFTFIKVNKVEITPTFVIDLNIKKLCRPDKPILNVETNVCSAVTSCSNAILCSNENIPVICKSKFMYDPNTTPNPKCENTCSGKYGKGAMSDKLTAFCNRKCEENMQKCEKNDAANTLKLYENYVCPQEFDRYGYKCINKSITKKSKSCAY